MGLLMSENQKRIEEAKSLLTRNGYHVIPVESVQHLIAETEVSEQVYFKAMDENVIVQYIHRELHKMLAYEIGMSNVTDIGQGKHNPKEGRIKFTARLTVIPAKVSEDPMLKMLREYAETKEKR